MTIKDETCDICFMPQDQCECDDIDESDDDFDGGFIDDNDNLG